MEKNIICKTTNMEIVIPTDENYFVKTSMSKLTDGNYKILGKIAIICVDEDESFVASVLFIWIIKK